MDVKSEKPTYASVASPAPGTGTDRSAADHGGVAHRLVHAQVPGIVHVRARRCLHQRGIAPADSAPQHAALRRALGAARTSRQPAALRRALDETRSSSGYLDEVTFCDEAVELFLDRAVGHRVYTLPSMCGCCGTSARWRGNDAATSF